MTNLAKFDIESDGQDAGYNASYGQVLDIKLRSTSGVSSVLFSVFDPGTYVSSLSIFDNPPRKSKRADSIQLVGATTGFTVAPTSLTTAVTFTMPTFGLAAWILRSVVNGGKSGNPPRHDPNLIWERMVVLRATNFRVPVATEVRQYEEDGMAGMMDDVAFASAGEPLLTITANNNLVVARTITVPVNTVTQLLFRWTAQDTALDTLVRQGRMTVMRKTAASLTTLQAYADDFTFHRIDGTWDADTNITGADVQQRLKGDGTNSTKHVTQVWAHPSPLL